MSFPQKPGKGSLVGSLLIFLFLLVLEGPLAVRSSGETASSLPETRKGDPHSCAPCHKSIYETFLDTAHFKTSRPANEESILGSFQEGKIRVKTGSSTYFLLEKKGDSFFQTAYWNEEGRLHSRKEEFEIVVGSGRKGQSFLFWKEGLLYQLPISYLTGIEKWLNSPGYVDGEVNFNRLIPPRCLECHSSSFRLTETQEGPRYSEEFKLGIRCSNCHGSGAEHIAAYEKDGSGPEQGTLILNPREFPRERQLDLCSLCHSASRAPIRPSFSYQPGRDLDRYLSAEPPNQELEPDFHASQIRMLRASQCFKNKTLSCSTCHNVHKTERNLSSMSDKCLYCHEVSHCRLDRQPGVEIQEYCVSCHMPNRKSRIIRINRPEGVYAPAYRSHLIAVYPDVSEEFLEIIEEDSHR